MIKTITFSLAVFFCLALATPGWADKITTTKGLPYSGEVTGYKDFTVSIKLANRNVVQKKIAEVKFVAIDSNAPFTQAEELLGKEKHSLKQVVALYTAAQAQASKSESKKPWLGELIAIRRYQALARAGQISLATKHWLKIVEQNQASPQALAIWPKKFSRRKSQNLRALKLLQARAKKLAQAPAKNKAYLQAVLKLQLALQQKALGQSQAAARTADILDTLATDPAKAAEMLQGKAPEQKPAADQPSDAPADKPVAESGTGDLATLAGLFEAGKVDVVAARIKSHIDEYPAKELPAALLLLGKSQLQSYRKSKGKAGRGVLLAAGVNLMWVFSEFPRSGQAPEALYYAAAVNRELNQPEAANLALREIIVQYDKPNYGDWAKKAKQELAKK
ncbi:MAG: hypothetical protein DRP83_06615 [Planctomycetota bacterium]|nr:MAG: hypothetical protein DRP83_06615 [Planctomycetota bacterium]